MCYYCTIKSALAGYMPAYCTLKGQAFTAPSSKELSAFSLHDVLLTDFSCCGDSLRACAWEETASLEVFCACFGGLSYHFEIN